MEALLGACDAVVVCSENLKHGAHIEAAAKARRAVLCEKPIAASRAEAERIRAVAAGVPFMTAFPCPFSPVFRRLAERVKAGEIGRVLAVCATNRGKCPGGWFTDPALSGGGAMIDHVVHVADLIWRLLGEEADQVQAIVGHNMHSEAWEDTAKVTVGYPSGVFATIDSSWSRPKNYRVWGDVALRVTGETGVIEVDLFGQGVDCLTDQAGLSGTGSDLDQAMVDEFVRAVLDGRPPMVTLEDGLRASGVALAAYESLG